ncbi:hypothetical protein N9Y63_02285 [Akkermansiaceae bacterium]|nr:hypothetical protein [Akkermansiaceae bacterium]
MKINLGKIEILARRNSQFNKSNAISESFLKQLNDESLDYLKKLTKEEIFRRIRGLSLEGLSSNESKNRALDLLKEKGIVVIPDFLEENVVNKISRANTALLKEISEIKKNVDQYYEDQDIVVQSGEIRLKSYTDISNQGKTVVIIRQGQDLGMIDIFNLERSRYHRELNLFDEFKNKKELRQLINGFERDCEISNLNLYHNESIKKTRGFHMDDFSNTFKAFIYLTDVEDLSCGPYCYVEGTHIPGPYRAANLAIGRNCINETESPYVPVSSIVPILAKKGGLVISDQTGIHRGIPQEQGFTRSVLVVRYQ